MTSIPDAIAKVLAEEFNFVVKTEENGHNGNGNGNGAKTEIGQPQVVENKPATTSAFANTDMCPECGNYSLVQEEGCAKCYQCGYSHC